MKALSDELDHGAQGRCEQNFGRFDGLPATRSPRWAGVPTRVWQNLERQMIGEFEEAIEDQPDPEENLYLPAGYTYFAQFVDHDLTFDTTSSVDLHSPPPRNNRTPRFDLDCLYGSSPADRPYMYAADKASFVLGRTRRGQPDLPRSFDPDQGGYRRAIIGDPRNDENSIVCQIHLAFMRFHNAVVERLRHENRLAGRNLFEAARNEVRWTYQRILVEDFLPRLVEADVLQGFEQQRKPNAWGESCNRNAFKLFRRDRGSIPIEFAGAGYRFGHSMVRNGYRLNADVAKHIFDSDPDDSLMGFEPLSDDHVIDSWGRFFPSPGSGEVWVPGSKNLSNNQTGKHRLQYAYRIDTSLVDPLSKLPPPIEAKQFSLVRRNLQRTIGFKLPSGQEVARVVAPKDTLSSNRLVTRRGTRGGAFELVPIPKEFQARTPLWFYVLAEAQASYLPKDILTAGRIESETLLGDPRCTGSKLGPVGGRILLEVFHGLLDSDPCSYRRHELAVKRRRPQDWLIKDFRMWHLVNREFKR